MNYISWAPNGLFFIWMNFLGIFNRDEEESERARGDQDAEGSLPGLWLQGRGQHKQVGKWCSLALVREAAKKTFFFGISFPNVGGWGGWFPNKVQTPQNPPKLPQKSPFSTQISPFVFPNLTKTLGWVSGKTDLGKISQKNFFLAASLIVPMSLFPSHAQKWGEESRKWKASPNRIRMEAG